MQFPVTGSNDTRSGAAPNTESDHRFERIDAFDDSKTREDPGGELAAIREEARAFRSRFAETGMPEYVETFDLVSVPYPTRFGFWRAGTSRSPFVTITNRLVVVRWRDRGGSRRTLLFEPTDAELGENTPFYRKLSARFPKVLRGLGIKQHATVLDRVRAIGIDPREVDFLAFDHQHTQDVRRLIGTRG
jgi:hypothetical protein